MKPKYHKYRKCLINQFCFYFIQTFLFYIHSVFIHIVERTVNRYYTPFYYRSGFFCLNLLVRELNRPVNAAKAEGRSIVPHKRFKLTVFLYFLRLPFFFNRLQSFAEHYTIYLYIFLVSYSTRVTPNLSMASRTNLLFTIF